MEAPDFDNADFTGYATRADILCTDGRTILPDAFAHQDKDELPLVWQHDHNSPMNVLGKVYLEHRNSSHPEGAGVYCYGFFNDTEAGQTTKALVVHGDVKALSIYANQLVEKAKSVMHGFIREVSVVLSGANKGAYIDNFRIAHSEFGEVETVSEEAIIYSGTGIHVPESAEVTAHAAAQAEAVMAHAEGDDESLEDIYNGWSERDKAVVHYMIGAAVEQTLGSAQHSDLDPDDPDDPNDDPDATGGDTGDTTTSEGDLTHMEGTDMTRNQFEQGGELNGSGIDPKAALTHGTLKTMVDDLVKTKGNFKDAILAHAAEYGITNIDYLFPEAKNIEETPDFISRRMEWVASVINGTRKTPFAKVRTVHADITEPEARAKGYVKGTRKMEEVFKLLKRTTGPGTIYKKQKLDRDDMLDITDINIVAWLKAEMRLMTEEELARAILVGDGRSVMDPDKVDDPMGANSGDGIRSILHDDPLYAIKKEMVANVAPKDVVKEVVRAMDDYRGSGQPVMYMGRKHLTELLLEDDRWGRPLYATKRDLADKMGVRDIIPVDIFAEYQNLYAIIVSLQDYNIGTNRGGELTSFEDFDIDFNQYKYLLETRLSGGLTKPFSAVVISRAEGVLAVAQAPDFDGATNTVLIPDGVAGVEYFRNGQPVAQGEDFVITEPTEISVLAADGRYLETGSTRSWTFNP